MVLVKAEFIYMALVWKILASSITSFLERSGVYARRQASAAVVRQPMGPLMFLMVFEKPRNHAPSKLSSREETGTQIMSHMYI